MKQKLQAASALVMVLAASAATSAGPTTRAAIEVGLTPEALGASGASVGDVQAVLGALQQAASERSVVTSARASLSQASRALSEVESALRMDPLNADLQSQRAAAAEEFTAAQLSLDQARAALLEAGTVSLGGTQMQVLRRCIEQSTMRSPAEIRAGSWTAEQRKDIEAAIVSEQRAAANVTPMPQAAQELLAEVRANAAVVAASQSLGSNLASIRSVFNEWQN